MNIITLLSSLLLQRFALRPKSHKTCESDAFTSFMANSGAYANISTKKLKTQKAIAHPIAFWVLSFLRLSTYCKITK